MGLSRAQGRGRPLGLVSAKPGLELSPALPAELLSAAPSAREGQPGVYQLCLSPAQAPFPPGGGPCVPTLQSHSGGPGELSHLLSCWPGAAWCLIPLGFPQESPWHGCGKQGSFHSRVIPGVAVALPQSWGALKPPCPRSQQCWGVPRSFSPRC